MRRQRKIELLPQNEIVFSEDFLASMGAKLSHKGFKAKYGYKSHLKKLKGFGKIKFYNILAK